MKCPKGELGAYTGIISNKRYKLHQNFQHQKAQSSVWNVLDMSWTWKNVLKSHRQCVLTRHLNTRLMAVTPHKSSMVQENLNFSLFSAFLKSLDLHKLVAYIENRVRWTVFLYLKFRILGDYEDLSQTCPMPCHMSSNFTGQDIGRSQLRLKGRRGNEVWMMATFLNEHELLL